MKKEETFEQNLEQLETIANELERGDLTLEAALEQFEKGIKLSKECNQKLDKAEKKINMLIENESGELTETEF